MSDLTVRARLQRIVVVVLAAGVALIASSAPAVAAQAQNAYYYRHWSFAGSTTGYWNVDQEMKITKRPRRRTGHSCGTGRTPASVDTLAYRPTVCAATGRPVTRRSSRCGMPTRRLALIAVSSMAKVLAGRVALRTRHRRRRSIGTACGD